MWRQSLALYSQPSEAGAIEAMTERYFEDFAVGQLFKPSVRVRIEKEDIIAFAQKYDPQPFHLDEEAARHSMFGRLVASGWHTAAVTMSLIARADYRAAGGTVGLGFDSLRWPMPVLPGDELHIVSEILEVRPSRSRPDRGLVKIRTRTLNQNGEMVQEVIGNAMVPRRPAGREG
jgi:acyl dehydratase